MLSSFLLFLSLVSYGLASYGGTECKAMRLDAPGGPMEKMPMQDQLDNDYCYAVTASMGIDAYRFSHGDKNYDHITSPFVLAQKHRVLEKNLISYYRDTLEEYQKIDPENIPDVQRIHDIQALIVQLGYLTAGTPKSVIPVNTKPKPPPLMLKQAGSMALSPTADYLGEGDVSITYYGSSDKDGLLASCDNNAIKKLAKEKKDLQTLLDLWTLSKKDRIKFAQEKEICALKSRDYAAFANAVDKASKETNLQDYLDQFTSEACKNKTIKVALPQPTRFFPQDTKKMTEGLKASLNLKNPQPVALAYCASFYLSNTNSPISDEACSMPHRSAVIGMRPSANGKCEFLVRNTWGDQCAKSYPKDKCENGQYWVDEDTMNNNAYEAVLLLDKDQKEELKADKSWQKK